MSSVTDVWNRALQMLGARRVSGPTEESANARACAACYSACRDAELRAHPWNFAIKRTSLAADATPPVFGFANSFTLPADYLRLLAPSQWMNDDRLDWTIEGKKLLTNFGAPLEIRYTARVENPAEWDSLFTEAVAAAMAFQMCEELTQSNTKKASAKEDYQTAITKAKRANAIEKPAVLPPTNSWVNARF